MQYCHWETDFPLLGQEVLEDRSRELGGSITHEIIFLITDLEEVGMLMGLLQANKQDVKHCQAGYILGLHGGELSMLWACNILENKTFTTDISYLFLREVLGGIAHQLGTKRLHH